jgi:TIR domain
VNPPLFLSYRRADSASQTSLLYDAIRRRFGAETVYMDTSSVAWGEEWQTALERAVRGANVIIVVIGPRWMLACNEWGQRHIDQRDDWVRREIELALSVRSTILPLLVGGMTMPPPRAFPEAVVDLATRQAISLSDQGLSSEVEAVLEHLAGYIPETDRRKESSGAVAVETYELPVRDEFRSVASFFYDAPIDKRIAAAEQIAAIGGLLDLDDVLEFGNSVVPAERIGAAIALSAHLRTSEDVRDETRVQSMLRALLNDTRSRVRYRAAELLRDFPALSPAYVRDLSWCAEHDGNAYVRNMARKALARAGVALSE